MNTPKDALPELPELPPAAGTVWDDYYDGITINANGPHDRYEFRDMFTPDQMLTYGRSCYEAGVRAERERAATKAYSLSAEAAMEVAEIAEEIRIGVIDGKSYAWGYQDACINADDVIRNGE